MAVPPRADLTAVPGGDPADVARLRTLLSAVCRHLLAVHLPRALDPAAPPVTDAAQRELSADALALAVGLACGAFDGSVDTELASERHLQAVRAGAAAHLVNGGPWGRTWQSPLVAGQLGLAAWLRWDLLSEQERGAVERLLADEADHLHQQPVHYLRDPSGRLLTPGDTGAEEESWRARGISIALAVLPDHPHAVRWQRGLVLRQLAAYARPSDVARTDLLHRSPLCSWLAGSNLEEDGTLQNHGFSPQPNYMRPVHHVAATVQQRLAGQSVSPSALHDLDLLYAALRRLYRDDGGLHYPAGTDVPSRAVVLYANDVEHRALGIGGAEALAWERLHGDLALRQVQPDGRIDEPGGTELFLAAQPDIAVKLAEAWLALQQGPVRPDQLDGTTLLGAPEQGAVPACPEPGPRPPDTGGTTALAASWVVARGLLAVRPDGRFEPAAPVTRLDAVRSLWRAAGSPADAPAHPFRDVPRDGGEADLAVRWAHARGVTRGRSARAFAPDEVLTRGQAVVLMWRGQGSPAAPPSGFGDVSGEVGSAVAWARAIGVSRGESERSFGPASRVNRGQWAAMLHRRYAVG